MRYVSAFMLVLAAAAVAACSHSSGEVPAAPAPAPLSQSRSSAQPPGLLFEHACGPAAVGFARCHAIWAASPFRNAQPAGYNPSDLQSAYNLTAASASNGGGQKVAIVDAYDDPNAESDMAVYRSRFGLSSCTTANGCFRKVDQDGGTSYPRPDRGWAEEISLDLDMVSAVCPKCRIVLVEAKDNRFGNLLTAENQAGALGATEISNSWGGSEFASEVSSDYNGPFNKKGIAITASSGDSGYGVEFPAASQYVTAVGGTTLSPASTARGWSEAVWSGAGSGCSAYVGQPAWQSAVLSAAEKARCSRRIVADVAAVANPNTGVSVYDSFRQTGWLIFGGTSASTVIAASVYALAGNYANLTGGFAYGSYPYSHASSLYDVTLGNNGSCGNFLCTGEAGYDGPTGMGTPKGTGAF